MNALVMEESRCFGFSFFLRFLMVGTLLWFVSEVGFRVRSSSRFPGVFRFLLLLVSGASFLV